LTTVGLSLSDQLLVEIMNIPAYQQGAPVLQQQLNPQHIQATAGNIVQAVQARHWEFLIVQLSMKDMKSII